MKSIVIVHPSLTLGGSTVVLINMIEALLKYYSVTVISTSSLHNDFYQIKKFYKTKITINCFKEIVKYKFAANRPRLAKHLLMRWCKKNQQLGSFISTSGFMDFGKISVQYINYPSRNSNYRPQSVYTKLSSWISDFISGFEEESRVENLSICNSNWTRKELLLENPNMKNITVLYPPCNIPKRKVNYNIKKKNSFIAIGRISKEKRIEDIIDIINFVALTKKVSLTILGTTDKKNSSYLKKLKKLIKGKNFIKIIENPPYQKVQYYLNVSYFGIHAMPAEHFGIVIAEMIAHGCITFVPNNGGQTEIIDNNDLIYCSKKDAVNKILAQIDSSKNKIIRNELEKHSEIFDKDIFQKNFLKYIKKNEWKI